MPRPRPSLKNSVGTLFSLAVDCIASDLIFYMKHLNYLPSKAKEKILRKLVTKCPGWNCQVINEVLSALTYPSLKYMNLSSLHVVDDETLGILNICRGLTQLKMKNNYNQNISSEGLMRLFTNMHSLMVLNVSHCLEFNDDVTKCLARNCTKLCELVAKGCNITDHGFMFLTAKNRNLQRLTISETKITGDGIAAAVESGNCYCLQEFRIDNCPKTTDNVLKAIAENCPKMEILTFYGCAVTDETLFFENINKSCKNLKQLQWTIEW